MVALTVYIIVSSGSERKRLSKDLKKVEKQQTMLVKELVDAHRLADSLHENNVRKDNLMANMIKEEKRMAAELATVEEQRESYLQEVRDLASVDEGNIKAESLGDNISKEREEAMKKKIELLKYSIQNISRREVLDRFGKGPHKVEMKLDFPESAGPGPDTFVIQLAPVQEMPHTVHTFLEQVYLGLWNGCSFFRNAPHVMQATPRAYSKNIGEDKESAFVDSGYFHLAFQEYSENYPHKKYTLGFAGRPAGPDFYINVWDNSQAHGPGGQKHHDLPSEADPCFGRIVEGLDTIERLQNLPSNRKSFHRFVEPVGIMSAQIIWK